ncbi:unnamed protein product [Absidia cylindrospora]
MTTVLDKNVHNLSVEGTFDDCQDIVKNLFSNREFNDKHRLGAVNSINWARILAQTVYYFHAYFLLLRSLNIDAASAEADKIKFDFSVPTGNFGDILAGYYSYRMGLPTNKLIVATNENDILYRFFETNAYEKQTVGGQSKETLSPAMDILVSSNFERLLWYLARDDEKDGGRTEVATRDTALNEDLSDKAGRTVAQWMNELKTDGVFRVSDSVVLNARKIFDAAMVTDKDTINGIRDYHQKHNYVLDPHTSVGVVAADRLAQRDALSLLPQGAHAMICLATAHPAKFSEAVEMALKEEQGFDFQAQVLPKEFIGLLDKERSVVHVERADPQLVIDVIEKELKLEGVEF